MKVISVEHVSKKFNIVKNAIPGAKKFSLFGKKEAFWALDDVSFDVEEGESVGLIGFNGAGKSTMLKLITRIMNPTSGRIRTRGRLCGLIEVAAGFHPEMTGRENIYLNGTILGMTKKEIDSKLDEIIDFANIEKFIDTPVKRYSSGMYARLGFAVAAHVNPDVLIVDEVLSVGDFNFQKKCLGKMQDVTHNEGKTVIFVSHNLPSVRTLCKRAIFLKEGQVVMDGNANEVIDLYINNSSNTSEGSVSLENVNRIGNGDIKLTSLTLRDKTGAIVKNPIGGEPLTLEFGYNNINNLDHISFEFWIEDEDEKRAYSLSTKYMNYTFDAPGKTGLFKCHIPRLSLARGTYKVNPIIYSCDQIADHVKNAIAFDVTSSIFYPTGMSPASNDGICLVDHSWNIERQT